MQIPETLNLDYLDEQYQRYKKDPQSVSREWRVFFYGFDIGQQQFNTEQERQRAAAQQAADLGFKTLGTQAELGAVQRGIAPRPAPEPAEGQVGELIQRYRQLGHLLACMDPLSECPTEHPLLSLDAFGLSAAHLEKVYATPQFSFIERASLKEILQILKQTYCRSVGVEYMHLQDPDERRWLQERMEPTRNQPGLQAEEKRHLLEKLTDAAMFENFLNKRYLAVTRFSLEGGDGIIPMLDALLRKAATHQAWG